MPVYNEREAVGAVIEKWYKALESLRIDFIIRPYNDGSKDDSLEVMKKVAAGRPRIEVRDKQNGGHGHTILTGYREAVRDGFDWVFQIDSDDEMGPEKFGELWSHRKDFDFLVGYRDGRLQPLPRKVISYVSRCVVRFLFGKTIWDVNTPYRLMRTEYFKSYFSEIPEFTFAPNVIISGLAARGDCRRFEMPVSQHDRRTGEVSIKKWKLLKAAAKSFSQTIAFGWSHAALTRKLALFSFVCLAVYSVLSVSAGFLNGLNFVDFQWAPSRVLLKGQNPYLFSISHLMFENAVVVANQVPSCLALLFPYAIFPRLVANTLWDVSNLFFTALFLFCSFKLWFSRERRCVDDALFLPFAILFLAGSPLRVLIGNGQHLMFSLSFFMAALYACHCGRKGLGGLLLAISAFKYTTIAPLAMVFIFRKEWKAIGVALVLHIFTTLACAFYVGASPVDLVLQSFQVGTWLVGHGCADLSSVMYSYGASLETAKKVATLGYVFFSFICILIFFGRKNELLKLSILSLVANMMFYHRGYDLVVLAIPVCCVLTTSFLANGRFRVQVIRNGVLGLFVYVGFCKYLYAFLPILASFHGVFVFLMHVVLLILFFVEMFSSDSKNEIESVVHKCCDS